jgi:hypothetical protein
LKRGKVEDCWTYITDGNNNLIGDIKEQVDTGYIRKQNLIGIKYVEFYKLF